TLLALALTIASCGGGNTTQNNSGSPSADATAKAATPAAQEPEQPAVTQQPSSDNTDEQSADSGNGQKVFGDINQDGNQDCITYTDQDLQVSIAGTSFNKKYIVEDEYSDRNITEITINQKGVIKILTTWMNSRGADGDDNYTVRFQDGDLYLIGYDNYYKPATNESYNLLTLKKERISGLTDDEPEKTTSTLKKIPLHRLSEIKIGEYRCEDYEE
ncbi:MAG: hypothetical protein II480_04800, partial [Bacteroidales bacterium]|nr:hypothetical protein [Bacteroidales bacterium]